MTWKTILITVLLALLSFGGGVYYKVHKIDIPVPNTSADVKIGEASDDQSQLPPITVKGRINILLIGEDNVGESKRSDTVAFVALDIDGGNMRVLSLPRDTRVEIPGHGHQKLNHAYAYGKQDLLKVTVERFLGTNIHYYVKIDYDNFPKLVDLVGGVDIFVGKPMKYVDKKANLHIDIQPGKQHMNGETALKYVRFRKDALGDIGRVQRQQQFLKALLYKLYEPENLLRFPILAKEITATLHTDMDPSMTLQLCLFVKALEKETSKIFFLMLPGTPSMIDGLSYWVSDAVNAATFLNANTDDLISMDKLARETNKSKSITSVSSAADYQSDTTLVSSDDSGLKNNTPTSVNTNTKESPSPKSVMSIVSSIPEAVAILNGTGRSGVGQKVAVHLQKMGVDVVYIGNAKHFDYKSSNVIYPDGAGESVRNTAQLLSKLCGISSSLTRANRLATYPSLIVGHDYEILLKRLENSYATIN